MKLVFAIIAVSFIAGFVTERPGDGDVSLILVDTFCALWGIVQGIVLIFVFPALAAIAVVSLSRTIRGLVSAIEFAADTY